MKIGFEFDGLCQSMPEIGTGEIAGASRFLRRLSYHYSLVLVTRLRGSELEGAKRWLDRNAIPYTYEEYKPQDLAFYINPQDPEFPRDNRGRPDFSRLEQMVWAMCGDDDEEMPVVDGLSREIYFAKRAARLDAIKPRVQNRVQKVRASLGMPEPDAVTVRDIERRMKRMNELWERADRLCGGTQATPTPTPKAKPKPKPQKQPDCGGYDAMIGHWHKLKAEKAADLSHDRAAIARMNAAHDLCQSMWSKGV